MFPATATTTSSDVAPSGVNTPRASTSLPRIPSAAPPGTPLTGINILKAGTDPIALADDAYPAWLWTLTENGSATDTSGATSSDEDDEAKKSIRLRIRKARERFIKEQNVASRKRR